MDDELKMLAVEMYNAVDEKGRRMSVQKICVELNIHPPDLYRAIYELDVPLRRTQSSEGKGSRVLKMYAKNVIDLVVRMANEERMTARSISEVLGIRYSHALIILHDEGVKVRKGRPLGTGQERMLGVGIDILGAGGIALREIQERLDGGMSAEMIAADLGTTTAIISDAIAKIYPSGGEMSIVSEKEVAALTGEVLRRVKSELGKT